MAKARARRKKGSSLEAGIVSFVNSVPGALLIAAALLGWHFAKKAGKLPASAPDIEIPKFEIPKI